MRILAKLILFLFIINSNLSNAQWFAGKEVETRTINLGSKEETIKASVITDTEKKTKPVENLSYCWYVDKSIKETQGGFDGKLLHGEYKIFYADFNLKAKGNFYFGLKDGVWKYWHPNGKLEKIEHWKKGFVHGKIITYSTDGTKLMELSYDKGEKDGPFIQYKDGVEILKKENYRKGQLHGKQYVRIKNELTNHRTYNKGKLIEKETKEKNKKEKKEKSEKEGKEKKAKPNKRENKPKENQDNKKDKGSKEKAAVDNKTEIKKESKNKDKNKKEKKQFLKFDFFKKKNKKDSK